jgi:hypothetical protein
MREAFNRAARKIVIGGFAAAMALPGAAIAAEAGKPPAPAPVILSLSAADAATGAEQIRSGSAYSRRVETLQQRFNRAVSDADVVVIDKDWFEINFAAKMHETSPEAQELRTRLLSNYIYERTGRRMSDRQIETIAENVLSDSGEAYIIPYRDIVDSSATRACIVLGERADMSARDQTLAMLALHPLTHGERLGNAALINQQPLGVMNRLTDYHEIGHCMDKWYMPLANRADKGSDPFRYNLLHHESEAYADAFAILMLARDGDVNIAEIANYRANMRLAALALAGPLRTQLTGANDPTHEGGYIYAVHGAVRAAGVKAAELGAERLRAMGLDEIRELARQITDANALKDPAQEYTITYMLGRNFDLSGWETQRHALPHVERNYQFAAKLKTEMNAALRAVLDLRAIPQGADIVGATPYNPRGVFLIARTPDAIVQQDRREMTARLLAASSDRASLLRTFSATKDALRAQLSNESLPAQRDAARKLRAMPQALIAALGQIEPAARGIPTANLRPNPERRIG